MPTRDQLIQNVEALERQGASQGEIQEYLDSFKQSPQKETGFIQGAVQDVASPYLRLGATAVGRTIDSGYLGKAEPFAPLIKEGGLLKKEGGRFRLQQPFNVQGFKDVAGAGAEIASQFVGGGAAKSVLKSGLKGLVKQGAKTGLKEGARTGFLYGAGRGLQDAETLPEFAGKVATSTLAGATGGLTLGAAAPVLGLGAKKIFQKPAEKVSEAIKTGIDRGIKPYFGKIPTQALRDKYYKAGDLAVRTINRIKPTFTDDGISVQRNPKTRAELLEAIDQTKGVVFKEYNQLAKDAGAGKFNPNEVIRKLGEVAKDKKYNPQVRSYAQGLIPEINELKGQPPEVIQERIKDLNASLGSFYSGRVDKAKAQVDASVASLIREQLDSIIENLTGKEYQALKNQYGALKTIEKDVARQVAVELRKSDKSLLDFTDIFTGGDLAAGILTGNPALLARGIVGRGAKEYIKYLNNPNRYIERMFRTLETSPSSAGARLRTKR